MTVAESRRRARARRAEPIEVDIALPTGDEAKRAARLLVEWARRVLEKKAV